MTGETFDSLSAWSFVGPADEPAYRAFAVDGSVIKILELDVATLSATVVNTFPGPADAIWSAAGDLDGDGLPDVVVATGGVPISKNLDATWSSGASKQAKGAVRWRGLSGLSQSE